MITVLRDALSFGQRRRARQLVSVANNRERMQRVSSWARVAFNLGRGAVKESSAATQFRGRALCPH